MRTKFLVVPLLWCGLQVSTWGAPPSRQGDWERAYDNAVERIETALKQNAGPDAAAWREASDLLNEAIAIKPEPQTGRFGMLVARRKEYFPYFYLGVALLRSERWEESRIAFEKAREFGAVLEDRESSRELRKYESVVHYRIGSDFLKRNQADEAKQSFEKAEKLGGLPDELKPSLRDQLATASQRIEAARMSFEERVKLADSHLQSGRFGPALLAFAEAERLDPTEFKRRDLGGVRDRARNGHVDLLLAEAREEHAGASMRAAHAKLKQALAILPNRADVRETLRRIVGDYPSLKSTGDKAYQDRDWAIALGNYQRAMMFFLREANRDALGPRADAASKNLIFESVEMLLTGKVEETVGALSKALENGAEDVRIHAWLGVAYAKKAFRAADPNPSKELREKALEEFRQVRSQDPQYRLPPRLVSPLILSLFESAGNP